MRLDGARSATRKEQEGGTRATLSHSGFPVQHHRHPSRGSAWFKAAQCAALELRDEEFAEVAGSE